MINGSEVKKQIQEQGYYAERLKRNIEVCIEELLYNKYYIAVYKMGIDGFPVVAIEPKIMVEGLRAAMMEFQKVKFKYTE